jgi:hypothetical protein
MQNENAVTGSVNDLESLVSVLDARSHSERPPKSKWRVRFFSVRHQWVYSSVRQVAIELCKCPLRIFAILRTPEMGFGPTIPPSQSGQRQPNLYPPSKFALACIEGIQELRHANPWMGNLELQMAAQAFQLGARWAQSTEGPDSEKRSADIP